MSDGVVLTVGIREVVPTVDSSSITVSLKWVLWSASEFEQGSS